MLLLLLFLFNSVSYDFNRTRSSSWWKWKGTLSIFCEPLTASLKERSFSLWSSPSCHKGWQSILLNIFLAHGTHQIPFWFLCWTILFWCAPTVSMINIGHSMICEPAFHAFFPTRKVVSHRKGFLTPKHLGNHHSLWKKEPLWLHHWIQKLSDLFLLWVHRNHLFRGTYPVPYSSNNPFLCL